MCFSKQLVLPEALPHLREVILLCITLLEKLPSYLKIHKTPTSRISEDLASHLLHLKLHNNKIQSVLQHLKQYCIRKTESVVLIRSSRQIPSKPRNLPRILSQAAMFQVTINSIIATAVLWLWISYLRITLQESMSISNKLKLEGKRRHKMRMNLLNSNCLALITRII